MRERVFLPIRSGEMLYVNAVMTLASSSVCSCRSTVIMWEIVACAALGS